jgi:hypothetical protein
MRSRFWFWSQLTLILMGAAGTVGLALVEVEQWHPTQAQLWSLLGLVGVTSVLGPAAVLVANRRTLRAALQTLQEYEVGTILEAAAIRIARMTGIDLFDLGLNAWLARGPFWRRELRRLGAVYHHRPPGPSGIRWYLGKGIIGRCAKLGRDVGLEVDSAFSEWEHVGSDKWEQEVPEEIRLELGFEEFALLASYYHFVLATPIIKEVKGRRTPIGCVVVEAPSGSESLLTDPDVRDALYTAGVYIVRYVGR